MSRWASDIATLRATVEAFEDYLFSDSLYRTLLVHTPQGDLQPTISAGRLLADLHRLAQHEMELSPSERAALQQAREQADVLRRRYETRYVEKLRQELRGLLSSWRWFLDDCLARLVDCVGVYRSEVHTRLRIELLIEELSARLGDSALRQEQKDIEQMDQRLRTAWQPGDFILKDGSEAAYPRGRFWFLYGQPLARED